MEKRPYRMRVRAQRQVETRQRIVEAAVELHSTLGPAQTSFSAVAERAGVQRSTLYAHFSDERALWRACSAHWRSMHPFPSAEVWEGIEDPLERLAQALREVYAWYASVEPEYALFARDAYHYPAIWQEGAATREAIARRLAASLSRRKAVAVAVGHAFEFETWRSLVTRRGLSNDQAANAMVTLVSALRA
jgi:AcrR family transcriptional regulator